MCMSPSSVGNCTIYSTWCIMICLVIAVLSLLLFIQSLSNCNCFLTCLLSFLLVLLVIIIRCHRPNPKTLILLQRLVIFRSERVNETIVVPQEQNLLFYCVYLLLLKCTYMYMYIVMSCSMVRTELKGLMKKSS